MILTFLIAFFSIMALLVVHEFGHFILAKKFGTDVEEFGVGYPPRLFGKKIGDTVYSLNLIPFGAFVSVKGEQGGVEDYRSFSGKPMWQRLLIVLGGVISFWVVSALLLGIIAGTWGLPMQVSDEDNIGLTNPRVQIVAIAVGSPAHEAELMIGDVLLEMEDPSGRQIENITKIGQVQDFIQASLGEEVVLTLKRGGELVEKEMVPRESPPELEGPLGVQLARTALKSYLWYEAPLKGIQACGQITANIIDGWIMGLKSLFRVEKLPAGVEFEMMGPLGIFDILREYSEMGINYLLFLVSIISIALALANILPIPALDGGKVVFLAIEYFRGKPINPKVESTLTTIFFMILIVFMVFVTVKFDIPNVFFGK